jgi:hypothetical protein
LPQKHKVSKNLLSSVINNAIQHYNKQKSNGHLVVLTEDVTRRAATAGGFLKGHTARLGHSKIAEATVSKLSV